MLDFYKIHCLIKHINIIPMNNYNEIHKILRLIREYNKMSIREFAGKHNISPANISEIERGIYKPRFEVLEAYSKEFNIPMSTILLFTEDNTSKAKQWLCKKAISLLEWIQVNAKIEKERKK